MTRGDLKEDVEYLIHSGYRKGETITLKYDDGTDEPEFETVDGGRWIKLKNIQPLVK
mgnify:CR=1 FL=1